MTPSEISERIFFTAMKIVFWMLMFAFIGIAIDLWKNI